MRFLLWGLLFVVNGDEPTECGSLRASLTALQADIDVYAGELNRCAQNHAMAEDMLTNCHDSLEREKRTATSIKEQLEHELERLRPFENEVNKLESEVERLKSYEDELKKNGNRLEEVEAEAYKYQVEIDRLKVTVEQLKQEAELDAIQDQKMIKELESEINRISDSYKAAEDDVKNLLEHLEAAEIQLKAAEKRAEEAELMAVQQNKQLPLSWNGLKGLTLGMGRLTKATGITLVQRNWRRLPPGLRAMLEEQYDVSISLALRSVSHVRPHVRRLCEKAPEGVVAQTKSFVITLYNFILGRISRLAHRLDGLIRVTMVDYVKREIVPHLPDEVADMLPNDRTDLAMVFSLVGAILYFIVYGILRVIQTLWNGIIKLLVFSPQTKANGRKVHRKIQSPEVEEEEVVVSATTKPSPRKRKTRR